MWEEVELLDEEEEVEEVLVAVERVVGTEVVDWVELELVVD